MSYSPDPVILPKPPYDTVFLSQRDLSLPVPVNFVTVPGVSISQACFGLKIFEDVAFAKCMSNLLASGFRRLELDLFWDDARLTWSLCPAKIPDRTRASSASMTTSSTLSISSSEATSMPKGQIDGSSETPSQSQTSTLPTSLPFASSQNGTANTVEVGPYRCTATLGMDTLLGVLYDYIQQTETTVDANLIYITFNIHSGANSTAPNSPAPSPTRLPEQGNFIGGIMAQNLTSFIYSETNLFSDRENLNASWYKVADYFRPVEAYYSTSKNINGIVSTEDGWPSEAFIELTHSKRLLIQWGSIDPQMASYNFSADDGTIFSRGYLQSIKNLAGNRAGDITQGCLFNGTGDLSTFNSSFAIASTVSGFDYAASTTSNLTSTLNLTTNMVNCGISPLLNTTLLNSTADLNQVPYQNFTYASLWSWGPGEPTANTQGHKYRCASTSTKLNGRWTATVDCSSKLFAACRPEGNPYNFTISSYATSYSFAAQACKPLLFAVPRTPLENSFLVKAINDARRDLDGSGLWVNWNSPTDGCWVSGNITCPYGLGADILRERSIIIPTVAAIIVLIVTSLTLFVKVAGNRRVRKRTKKRTNGFVYEGIPS